MSWNEPYISEQFKKNSREECTQMIQVKKQLTAGPHFLVNNQGKPFLKQYKMSPQADALSIRIMRFFAPWYDEHILHCLYKSKFSFPVSYIFSLPFKIGNMPCLKYINVHVATDEKTYRSRFTNSNFWSGHTLLQMLRKWRAADGEVT